MSNLKIRKTFTLNEFSKQKQAFIDYGFTNTRFGSCLIGFTHDTLCYFLFYNCNEEDSALNKLKQRHPKAVFTPNQDKVTKFTKSIFNQGHNNIEISLIGTEFQTNVWKELTKIKAGCTKSYEDIAKAIGKPTSIRAVANAVAHNNIAYVVPCHRVIRKNGQMAHKSRWGLDRKQQMLEYESGRTTTEV